MTGSPVSSESGCPPPCLHSAASFFITSSAAFSPAILVGDAKQVLLTHWRDDRSSLSCFLCSAELSATSSWLAIDAAARMMATRRSLSDSLAFEPWRLFSAVISLLTRALRAERFRMSCTVRCLMWAMPVRRFCSRFNHVRNSSKVMASLWLRSMRPNDLRNHGNTHAQ